MSEERLFLPREGLQRLLDELARRGYRCIGPVVRDGAIVFDEIGSADRLPRGVEQEQAPGRYRLRQAGHDRVFAWANGPQGIKPWLFAPHEVLWRMEQNEDGPAFVPAPEPAGSLAVIGLRPCDIAALYLQDHHFLHGIQADSFYRARRSELLVVAVNCTHPAATCFCASTGDGPGARFGFDLALTELDDGFLVQPHSGRGMELARALGLGPAGAERVRAGDAALARAARQQRALPARDLREPLYARLGAAHWHEVGERCLACGNCTAVCPTCFCHREWDEGGLDLDRSEHVRGWDSCFTSVHSHIHGLTLRPDTASRYRQWLVHKLGTWHEQYGRSGCVGCGRCIAWCPVGIDITEEVARLCREPVHG